MERSYTLKLCARKVRSSWHFAIVCTFRAHVEHSKGLQKDLLQRIIYGHQFSHWHPHIFHTSSSDLLRHWFHITTGGTITPTHHGAIIATRSEGPIIGNDLPLSDGLRQTLATLGHIQCEGPPKRKTVFDILLFGLGWMLQFRPWLYWGRWVSKAFYFESIGRTSDPIYDKKISSLLSFMPHGKRICKGEIHDIWPPSC